MKDKKKIIGVCLTRAEDDFRTSFLTHFQNCAIENNFKLIVFNSPSDFINKSINDNGSKKIYDLINYDVMDAFVILCETIYDHSLTCQLTEKAHSCNIPVILIHEQAEGCFCVVRKYTEEFKTMLRHLFSVHGIKKPVFIGGYKENDPQTQIRLECFRDVLSEFGTEYSSDMVFYGKYYEAPTTEIIQKILDSGTGIPDAFICANDMMAMAACNTLAANGYRVPEDIKVSGFDGIENAEYFIPGITTCKEDIRALAAQTADIINNALDGTMTPGTFYEHYLPVFRGSCGCRNDTETDYGKIVKLLFDRHFDSRQHEMHIYRWANSALYSEGINSLSSALKDLLLVDSSVFLYNDFIMTLFGTAPEGSSAYPHKEFTVIASHPHDLYAGRNGRFPAYDMMPDFGKWLENTSMCVLTPIIVGDGSCGVYCVYTDTPGEIADKMFRIAQNINIVFGALVSRIIKRNIQSSMMNAMYTDIPTGLPNLKGITKWFNEFSSNDSNHRLAIAVGVYSIPQYKYIFENYGTDEIEQAVKYTADALKIAYSDNKFIARTANDEFTVFSYSDFEDELNETVENSFSVFSGIIDAYNTNSDKKYFLEINYGRTIANAGWNGNLRTFIKLAGSEMYINKLKSGLIPVLKEDRASQDSAIKSPKELYTEFTLLVEKNLFTYFFQPIVYAKTGEIYAYEALMRTKGGINMSPLRILDIAKEYNMLYDIEKATMFNVMERYDRDRELFGNAQIFINTIPGCFLNKQDTSKLKAKYQQYFSNIVFEITEQDTVSDEELQAIRDLGVSGNSNAPDGPDVVRIAIDDYGTGHSNIVNLLRYSPYIIKIDRFLINNIQNEPNKQMFVKSTIEFAKMNDIKVLAEGVETYEEMKTVIGFGVDLLQGYYTSRPAPDPVGRIPDNIREEIAAENLNISRYDNELLVYRPKDGESVELSDLAFRKYGCIHLSGGSFTIAGNDNAPIDTVIKVDDGAAADITIDSAAIRSLHSPAVQLGKNCKAVIRLRGNNTISGSGILVPQTSSLLITGDGNLDISVSFNNGVGIGNDYYGSFGNITFEHSGRISVESQGDNGICIGGSISDAAPLKFRSGIVYVTAKCVNSLGIGCISGKTDIMISDDAVINVRCAGKNSVGIGSFEGETHICSKGNVDVVSDGERSAAVGTIGTGVLTYLNESGRINAVVHGNNSVCIGSLTGTADISILSGHVNAYGEGDAVCGMGSAEGSGKIHITGGVTAVKLLSGNAEQFGGSKCTTVITGGIVDVFKEQDVNAVNDFGDRLHPVHCEGDTFEQTISSPSGEYIYKAEKIRRTDNLCVYLP